MHEVVIVFAKYVIIVPVAALVFMFVRLNNKRRLELLIFLGTSVVVTVVLAKLAAVMHQDPRPFVRDGVTPYFAHGIDNGFPSDHTTYSAVIAFVLFRYSRWLGGTLAVTSLAIGTSRVIAGVHHGQDIVGGFMIAALGVGLSFLVLKVVESRYFAQKRVGAVE